MSETHQQARAPLLNVSHCTLIFLFIQRCLGSRTQVALIAMQNKNLSTETLTCTEQLAVLYQGSSSCPNNPFSLFHHVEFLIFFMLQKLSLVDDCIIARV